MVTVGAVTSGAVIVHVKDCDAVRTPSDTVAFTVNAPADVGVPEMKPVDDCSVRPAGSPVTL